MSIPEQLRTAFGDVGIGKCRTEIGPFGLGGVRVQQLGIAACRRAGLPQPLLSACCHAILDAYLAGAEALGRPLGDIEDSGKLWSRQAAGG